MTADNNTFGWTLDRTAPFTKIEQLTGFREMRFDKHHHLGLGDIRLTIAQQDEIEGRIANLERENAEMREFIGDLLGRATKRRFYNALEGKLIWGVHLTAGITKKYPWLERYLENPPANR